MEKELKMKMEELSEKEKMIDDLRSSVQRRSHASPASISGNHSFRELQQTLHQKEERIQHLEQLLRSGNGNVSMIHDSKNFKNFYDDYLCQDVSSSKDDRQEISALDYHIQENNILQQTIDDLRSQIHELQLQTQSLDYFKDRPEKVVM